MREAVVIIAIKDSQFYVSRRLDQRKPFFNYWQCPGGSIEKEEDKLEAAQREVEEEMGISVPTSSFLPLNSKIRTYKNGVKYVAHNLLLEIPCFLEPLRTEPHKSSEWELVSLEELEKLTLIPGIYEICASLHNSLAH